MHFAQCIIGVRYYLYSYCRYGSTDSLRIMSIGLRTSRSAIPLRSDGRACILRRDYNANELPGQPASFQAYPGHIGALKQAQADDRFLSVTPNISRFRLCSPVTRPPYYMAIETDRNVVEYIVKQLIATIGSHTH